MHKLSPELETYLNETDGPWHIRRDDRVVGPYTREQILQLVDDETVSTGDYLRSPRGTWTSLDFYQNEATSDDDGMKSSTFNDVRVTHGRSSHKKPNSKIEISKSTLIIAGVASAAILLTLVVLLSFADWGGEGQLSPTQLTDATSDIRNQRESPPASEQPTVDPQGVLRPKNEGSTQQVGDTTTESTMTRKQEQLAYQKLHAFIRAPATSKKALTLLSLAEDEQEFLNFVSPTGQIPSKMYLSSARWDLANSLRDTLIDLEQYEKAIEICYAQLAEIPNKYEHRRVGVFDDLSEAYFEAKNPLKALEYINLVLSHREKEYSNSGNLPQALIDDYRDLLAFALIDRAIILMRVPWIGKSSLSVSDMEKDYKLAILDLEKAITLRPGYRYPYLLLGSAAGSIFDFRKGLEAYDKCIELRPNDSTGYVRRATLKSRALTVDGKRGVYPGLEGVSRLDIIADTSEGIRLQIIEKNNDVLSTLNSRAYDYIALKEYRLALADADRITSLVDGDHPYTFVIYGSVSASKGDLEAAVVHFSKAMAYKKYITFYQAINKRASIYDQLGLKQKAEADRTLFRSINKADAKLPNRDYLPYDDVPFD
jgi:tetratricopeptide (TPR) repeat protein